MKKLLPLAILAASAGAASAGGLAPAPYEPAPAPVMMPAAVPAADWTGGYAGLSLGYGNGDIEGTGTDIEVDGAIGGGFAGYQYDFGSFVLGGELDLNAANLEGDIAGGNVSIDQVHRLKLRAGYDAGRALIYGTAGAAYAEGSTEVAGIETDFDDTGYVYGLGVDYKVTESVTVGAELLRHEFDDIEGSNGLDADATTLQARVAYQF